MHLHVFKILSVAILVAFTYPTCAKIVRGQMRQNVTTWVLWALLDGLTGAVVAHQGGNFWLPVTYAACSLAMAACVLYASGLTSWREATPKTKRRDAQIASLVAICAIVWVAAGGYWAAVAGTAAVILAGVPQLIDCWRHPEDNWTLRWFASATASALSAIAGKAWTVEERLFPIAVAIYCLLCAVGSSRKRSA